MCVTANLEPRYPTIVLVDRGGVRKPGHLISEELNPTQRVEMNLMSYDCEEEKNLTL